MDHWDDQQTIVAVLAGDVDAFAVLVKRYQKPIYNLMYRMTGSREDAADLSQDTFVKAFENLHRFREGSRFFPWLYTIGINRCRNFNHQKNARHTVPMEDWRPRPGSNHPDEQEENLCTKIDCRKLGAALAELPLEYREPIILRYHEECSMEDVAAALKISVSAAKMRVHRGLKKLREALFNSL